MPLAATDPHPHLPESLLERLQPFLSCCPSPTPAVQGGPAKFSLTLQGVSLIAEAFACSAKEAMVYALERNIWPTRFLRNSGILFAQEQALLLQRHVVILGCGGLGGYLCVALARLGIGTFTCCDPDIFEETNLNRQRLCYEDNIGQAKALAAQETIHKISSHAAVRVHKAAADDHNLMDILKGAHIAADCLDNFPSRFALEKACARMGIPFVHGSLAGLEGFVMLCQPGSNSFSRLYPHGTNEQAHGAEMVVGTPTPTAASVAILQTMVVLQALVPRLSPILSTPGQPLLHLDLGIPELEWLVL